MSFADDPSNWQAAPPTPGTVSPGAFSIDTDHDGVLDELEFLAGTDPLNSLDFLKFNSVSSDGANCVLEFTVRAGRSYTVEKLSQLGGGTPWTVVRSIPSGDDSVMTVLDPLGSQPAFYRLKVKRN